MGQPSLSTRQGLWGRLKGHPSEQAEYLQSLWDTEAAQPGAAGSDPGSRGSASPGCRHLLLSGPLQKSSVPRSARPSSVLCLWNKTP